MTRLFFEHHRTENGALLRLMEKPWIGKAVPVPIAQWAERMADGAFTGVSRILALLDEANGSVESTDDGVRVDHATLASFNEPQALGLGLPPAVRYALQIETKSIITQPDFRITGHWIGAANRPLRVRRQGAFLDVEGHEYRLPEPLFSLVESLEAFAATNTADSDVRMAKLAHLRSVMPEAAHEQLSFDQYFSSFRILHAAAFSLSLTTNGRTFDFDPVLFGRRVVDRAKAENKPISEAEGLLTGYQQDLFASQRFRGSNVVKPSYVIEKGVYVHLDSSLCDALTVVRQMQSADAETRKRFAQVPQLYLKEALSKTLAPDDVEQLFIETEQYSSRVLDVGVWAPPVLPWIKKEPNDWLPEKFGLQIGGQYIVLDPDDLTSLREQVAEARAKGEPFVIFGKEKTPIPATPETEQSLISLIGMVRPEVSKPTPERPRESDTQDEEANAKHVLIVKENFETIGFTRQVIPRSGNLAGVSTVIVSVLKQHQKSGLNWLQETWTMGYPGVLLADDMGLGKTLQALAFLVGLRESRADAGTRRSPFLIVAPTGLLANWEKEHNHHLRGPGLGEVCRAYGRHLAVLKTASTRETDRGAPSLDNRRIREADWVLTTYETLRDYHLSFAAIPFACVIFDEMQKVKAPTTLLTRAAKTLNADFMIGITGTPIENQLADLWCIMDIINPGCLGDLKTFSSRYPSDDINALEQLRALLLDATAENPPSVLRRMKADHLDGLPEKKNYVRRRTMPESQAKVYAEIVTRAKQPDSGPMLETLHLLRGVSLHPIWPPAGEILDQQAFIDQSARLCETFSILDEIARRREKALIFLESLDLQEHLALMIQKRYGLKRRPLQINGQISGEKRQKLVDDFQNTRGSFDVMLLSPRAGGVGLTLTSANHVIHLSRWWNPAVEDQCTDRVYRIGQDRTVHVYYPMAVHPLYGDSSFDDLLNTLLERKRKLSNRMLIPPVQLEQDQHWFAENLGRNKSQALITSTDIEEIDAMEPQSFERWALSRCVSFGWEVSRTPRSHDGGADGILVHRESKARAIVQCKHKQKNGDACGSEAIDDLLRARANYSAVARLFALTNAEKFTRAAEERAKKHGIVLVSRRELPLWPRPLI